MSGCFGGYNDFMIRCVEYIRSVLGPVTLILLVIVVISSKPWNILFGRFGVFASWTVVCVIYYKLRIVNTECYVWIGGERQ